MTVALGYTEYVRVLSLITRYRQIQPFKYEKRKD